METAYIFKRIERKYLLDEVTRKRLLQRMKGELLLENGSAGASLLPVGLDLMEVKSLGAMPLSFARSLNELSITPSSFSKYGTAYTRSLVTTATSTETILKGGLKYVSNL